MTVKQYDQQCINKTYVNLYYNSETNRLQQEQNSGITEEVVTNNLKSG